MSYDLCLDFPQPSSNKSAKRAIFTPYIKERVHEKDTVYQCGRLFVACGRLSSAFRKGNSDNELTVNGGKKEFLMLVGSYAEPTEEGIKLYCFNEENGQAT